MLCVLAGIGLLVRLVLAPFTSFPNDDAPWLTMVVNGMQHLPVYARPGYSYPPVWGWLLELLGEVLRLLGVTTRSLSTHDLRLNQANQITGGALSLSVTSPLFNLCVKSILTLFDLATAAMLASVAPSVSTLRRSRELAFGLYFLNPLVVNGSAVQAGFDTLVAFWVAAVVALVIVRRPLLAGAALGMGVVTKLTPVFLAPLVLAVVVGSSGRAAHSRTRWTRNASLVVGGGLFAVAIVLVPLAATGQFPGFVEFTFSRVQTGLKLGGIGLGGLRDFRALTSLYTTAQKHNGVLLKASLVCELVVAAGVAIWALFRPRESAAVTVLAGSVVVMAVLLLTTPTSQPAYGLWLMPPAVLLCTVRPRAFVPPLAAFSLAAATFSLTYTGLQQVLFPLAEYTKLVSPVSLADSIVRWFRRPTGLWGSTYNGNYVSVCSAITILGLLALIRASLVTRRSGEPSSAGSKRPGGAKARAPSAIFAVVTAVLLIAEAVSLAVPSPGPGSLSSEVMTATRQGTRLDVTLSARRVADENALRVVTFAAASPRRIQEVEVVVDANLPVEATNLKVLRGVYDVLKSEFALRGYPSRLITIDRNGLRRTLLDTQRAQDIAVIDLSGVLPATVFGPHLNLVTPWLAAGGTLFFGGGQIGYFSGMPGVALANTKGLSGKGTSELLGEASTKLPHEGGRQATNASPVTVALEIQYQDATYAPSLRHLEGPIVTLGYTGRYKLVRGTKQLHGFYSSITSYPVGSGHLVIFGGYMYDATEAAEDIALIEMTGILNATSAPQYSTIRLDRSGHARFPLQLKFGTAPYERVVVFDPRFQGIALSVFSLTAAGTQAP